ncbi:CBS domain containing-hemolysin-like protein [Neolewinella xylanilytica]|uniref:CBS domain containing-hemolysin-like protein n=1 Tax=Neolewinella xylanilytica TaxID=1514080 RepID=A0A2S6I057_9BACT|nr:hemolysin family protein [Neolewinella xylanilytica]PPK84246.1 CBS domain containing-hemolysin-like protein [Neolewinella xylanilytica]
MASLLIFALLSIAFSFLCSIFEAVLLSITPSYVEVKVQEQSATGELLQRFKKELNEPLTAILSLNTIAHTVGAILVGASTGAAFGEGGFTLPLIGYDLSYEVIVSVLMTLAILIFSEIIPKNLGATYWKQLAPFTVKALNVLVKIFKLLGIVQMSNALNRLMGGGETHGTNLTRVEFAMMAEAQTKQGQLKEEEGRILRNLLDFESLTVHDVMTPRTVVVGAWSKSTIREFYEKFDDSPFSRYPVFGETRDQVLGYVLKDMVYKAIIEKRDDEPILELVRDLLTIPQDTSLHKLINLMLERRQPVALVVDEFGGMEGLVTMEDAMETLLGLEIMDEMDSTQDMQRLARERWKARARAMGLEVPETSGTPKSSATAEPTKTATDAPEQQGSHPANQAR